MPSSNSKRKAAGWSDGDGKPIPLRATAAFDFDAAKGEGDDAPKLARFRMVANTGAAMRLFGWKYPVVIDFAGVTIPSQSRPIRMDHDSGQGVGHTTRIAVEDGSLVAEGVVSRDTEAARDVVSSGKLGFPWQASVGMSVEDVEFVKSGEQVVVNARTFEGPLNVARKTTLGEISFVDLGADDATSAQIAAGSPPVASVKGAPSMFEQWLQAKGFDPAALDETQAASLRAMYDAEQAAAKKSKDGDGGGARPDPARKKRLEDVVAEQRAEDARVDEITQITAEAIADRPSLLDRYEEMAKAAIEAGTSAKDFRLAITQIRAELAPGVFIPRGDARPSADVIECSVCLTGGLQNPDKHFDDRTLAASRKHFPHGLGLIELFLIAAKHNGHSNVSPRDLKALLRGAFGDGDGRMIRAAQGWSTLGISSILSNVANKFLLASFDAVESTWRAITSIRSVRDFKAVTSYSLTGDMKYEKVGPGGEIKHGTLGELSYTNRVETYAKMFAITRNDLINDDLGALTQIPRKLGRGAALALNEVFWAEFLDNSSFFTSGNGNLNSGAGSALSLAALTEAEKDFFNQTDADGNPLAITPRILLVPNALSVTAANLMNSVQIANDTTANTLTFASNPHAGKFRVVQSSYLSNAALTGYSTTAWYLLADPNDLAVIETAFLNGREQPTVESADADFSTLGVQFRGYHDFGVSLMEYRAGVKNAGA